MIYVNTQASLLAYLCAKARSLKDKHGVSFEVINFDAYVDMKDLPKGNVIGIGELSMQDDGKDPIPTVTAFFMAGTENDPNNMLLTKVVSEFWEDVEAESKIDLLDESTAEDIGDIIFYGERIILPVEKNLTNKILQGVSFLGGALVSKT